MIKSFNLFKDSDFRVANIHSIIFLKFWGEPVGVESNRIFELHGLRRGIMFRKILYTCICICIPIDFLSVYTANRGTKTGFNYVI